MIGKRSNDLRGRGKLIKGMKQEGKPEESHLGVALSSLRIVP